MTSIKDVTIPTSELDSAVNTAFYTCIVTDASSQSWTVRKRYSQFEALYQAIDALFPGKLSDAYFPPKSMWLFFSHVTPEFVEERRVLLQQYVKKCVSLNDIAQSSPFVEFFDSDKIENQSASDSSLPDLPDDVEVTDILLPSFRTMSDHILFQVDVVNAHKRRTFQKWTILKRYGQFFDMDQAVRTEIAHKYDAIAEMPPFPPRKTKLLVDHMDQAFAEGRRALLENYMRKMMRVPDVARSKAWLDFVGA